jgi:hypothetical protein
MKFLKAFIIITITSFTFYIVSCETIYDYDLSISGLDSLPATKSCILKYLPHSVDANPGRQKYEIEKIISDYNNYESEIIDSLKSDSIFIDSLYILQFKIHTTDPYDEVSEFDVEKFYFED